jgi:hypothetical protein
MAKVDKNKITQVLIKDLKDTKSEIDRLNKLYKFIKRVWKLTPPMEVINPSNAYLSNTKNYDWDAIYINLQNHSDDWDFSKLYILYIQYITNCKIIEKNSQTNFKINWKR